MMFRKPGRLFELAVCCSLFAVGCSSAMDSDKTETKKDMSDQSEAANAKSTTKTSRSGPVEGKSGQVLRHAVFFGFKEGSTAEEATEVTNAFRELPAKIDEIIDFGWGVNNSPEPLDDGYTHCFLLTFKDNAGREAYLPHPDHAAFGAKLGPIRDKVFVMDYWGTPEETEIEKPLRHCVFFKFKGDAAADAVTAVEDGFAELPSKIDTIKSFEWGLNNSPEKKDEGFTHCFVVTFDSTEGRQTYLDHPDHLAFVEILKPVLDKVRVLDFFAEK